MKRLLITIGATLVLTLASTPFALADQQKGTVEVKVTPSAKVERGYVVDAILRTTAGQPVNGATVTFYEVVELFGQRRMLLGTAATDRDGRASLPYLPARTGAHQIVARSGASEAVAAAEGTATFDATVAAAPYSVAAVPLASFSAKVPFAVGIVVLGVWALIAFAFLATARGVRSGARDIAHKEKAA